MNAPGVKLLCRASYEMMASVVGTPFDYPLSSRFDENDAIFVFDNVLIPWEDVLLHRDVEKLRTFFPRSGFLQGYQLQGCTRLAVKLDFLTGIIAKALRDIPSARRPLIFARGSLVWDELGNVSHDLRRASIRAQAELSLRRLETDHIDLYQLGWPVWPAAPNGSDPGSVEEAWDAMAGLQREGKVRFIGISKCGAEHLAPLQAIAPATSLMVPYSLLRREAENRARSCQGGDLGIIACSTLGSGLLTGAMTSERVSSLPHNDWRRRHPFFQEMALTRAASFVERLRTVGSRHNASPAAVAIAWALRHPAVTAAVVGARRPEQVDEIVRAGSIELSPGDVSELTSAPVPVLARR